MAVLRLFLSIALLFSATFATAAPTTATKAKGNVPQRFINMLLQSSSRVLPTPSKPSDLQACFCIKEGEHCSPILAAASGTCTGNTLRRRQTHPCILRCARFCFYKSPSLTLCQDLREWLDQKVYKILRIIHFGEPDDEDA